MPAQPYPIVLTGLHKMRCVVVGGGSVAERKVEGLLECAALVTLISPELTDQLQAWHAEGRFEHINRAFRGGDLAGAALAIAATSDRAANAEVAREAHQVGILVNVVDDPDAGTFNTVAAVRQRHLLLAVSTGGASPAVAALVRHKLETMFGPEYGELLALLAELRQGAMREVPAHKRPHIWRRLASDEVLDWLRAGQRERVQKYAQQLIEQAHNNVDLRF